MLTNLLPESMTYLRRDTLYEWPLLTRDVNGYYCCTSTITISNNCFIHNIP